MRTLTEADIRRIVQDEMSRGGPAMVQNQMQASNTASRFSLSNLPNHSHNGIDSPTIPYSNIGLNPTVGGNITFSSVGVYNLALNSSFTPSNIMLYGNAINASGAVTFNLAESVTVTTGTIYSSDPTEDTVGTNYFTVVSPTSGGKTLITTPFGNSVPYSSGYLHKKRGTGSGPPEIQYDSVSDTTSTSSRCFIFGTASLGPSFYFQPDPSHVQSVVTGTKQYPNIWTIPAQGETGVIVPYQSSAYFWGESPNIFKTLSGEGFIVDVSVGSTIYVRARVTYFGRSAIGFEVTSLASGWKINANIVVS